MADYFCSEPLPFEGTGIGYKSIVKLKVFAQPMHRVFVINFVSFSKLVYQNKNELPTTKILSFFALIAQPHQTIALRSD